MEKNIPESRKSSQLPESITLYVRSHFFNGSYSLTVKPLCLIQDIKITIIETLYRSLISGKRLMLENLTAYHRLLAPNKSTNVHTNHALRDSITILEAQLEDGDELYLLRTLPPLIPTNVSKTPRQLEMDELQDQMLEKEIKKEMKKAGVIMDRRNDFMTALDVQEYQAPEFFSDMRRVVTIYMEVVLITLCTLSNQSNVESVLRRLKTHFLNTLYPVALNPAFIIEMRELGYSSDRIKYAFHLNKNRNTDALEWLKSHKSIASTDIPRESLYQNEIELKRTRLQQMPMNDITLILDLFQEYRNYTFKPDLFASNNLKAMGYELPAVSDALKVAENSYPAALRILSGETSPSLTDMVYFPYPNRLYESLMERLLRYHILDAKVLIAILSFYKEPEKVIFGWCWNREIAPIIFEMFETYNLEIQDLYHCDRKYGTVTASC